MSHTLEKHVAEKPRRHLAGKFRKGGALVLSVAAFGGLAAPSAKAESAHARGAKTELAQHKLRNPNQLPGSKIHLSQEIKNRLKNSTIEIGARYIGDQAKNYEPGCTGVVVTLPGRSEKFVMSAAHCFGDITGHKFGAFSDPANPLAKAENFIGNSNKQYAILDPYNKEVQERGQQPVALVTNLSIDTDNKDVALLQVQPTDSAAISSPAVRNFNQIPAISLKIAEKAPLPGTPVALFGEPQANGFEPIAATGTYIDRIMMPIFSDDSEVLGYRQIDLVGINPGIPEEDNCNFGTSGSMAMLPNGKLLGNLSIRSNGGYGAAKELQWGDNEAVDSYWRTEWEMQAGIDLSGFSTICGYTVMDHNTPQELAAGQAVPASNIMQPQIGVKP